MTDSPSEKRLPVQSPEFWRDRLFDVVSRGDDLHKAVYNVDYSAWSSINEQCRTIIGNLARPGQIVLDAGCGYGSLAPFVPDGVFYVGVDISPDLIELANRRHGSKAVNPRPNTRFIVGTLLALPFRDREFDLVVVRSIRKMVIRNQGEAAWLPLDREVRRVGQRVLWMEYEEGLVWEVTY